MLACACGTWACGPGNGGCVMPGGRLGAVLLLDVNEAWELLGAVLLEPMEGVVLVAEPAVADVLLAALLKPPGTNSFAVGLRVKAFAKGFSLEVTFGLGASASVAAGAAAAAATAEGAASDDAAAVVSEAGCCCTAVLSPLTTDSAAAAAAAAGADRLDTNGLASPTFGFKPDWLKARKESNSFSRLSYTKGDGLWVCHTTLVTQYTAGHKIEHAPRG